MDSGNSGSLQSSRELDLASSAEEEYDSRSSFLNPTRPSIPNPNPNNPSSLFDSFSNYLDAFPRSPLIPNPNTINSERPWSLLPQNTNISPYNMTAGISPGISAGISTDPSEISTFPANPSRAFAGNPDQASPQAPAAKTGKKRSRASRRAPTTVLTTDTTNFRAMVQEFTGIPAPPFSASAFSRNTTRLDLLGGGLKSRIDSQSQQSPSFLLRPFAQKVLSPHSFLNSNSNPSFSLHLPNLTTSSPSISPNMANSFLNFQSLINSTTSNASTTKFLGDEFGIGMNNNIVSGGNMSSGATGLVSSNENDINNNTSNDIGNRHSWGDGSGGLNEEEHGYLRSSTSGGNYCNSQRVSSCKLNYTGSNIDFQTEKGSEKGMVDSWLCPSD